MFTQVMRLEWTGAPFEDRWRDWTTAVARLPAPLADEALESLSIEGYQRGGARALEQALRLKSPMAWGDLQRQVEAYLATARTAPASSSNPTPMKWTP